MVAAKKNTPYFNILLITVVTAILMLPVLHALSRSLEPPGYFDNYIRVITDPRLPQFYLNGVIVSAGTIFLTVIGASLAGFAFAKLDFPLRNVLFLTLIVTLLVPASTLIVPLFVLVRDLGLYNTHWALILPMAATSIPFHTVLVRNYFQSLPSELMDAARIDGCSDFGVFRHIMLPLSLPVQTIVIVLTFLGSWNNYLLPLIMLRDESMYTVPLAVTRWANDAGGLSQFGQVSYNTLFAALFVLAAPTVIIFLLFQRVFIGSVTSGAIRG